jgi:serine/threonine-protein kinase
LLRSHLVKDEQAAKDFLEEARVAGYLHHANVVAVSDAGFHGKQPYLVMDYVEGCSLKELLKNSPKPEPRFVLPVILDVLAGLHAVHSLQDESGTALNLVHCDVSPENLLVGVDGISRLTDFGVVRRASNGLSVSTKGKPGYASPELIRGDSFDRRADIFSMGVVLWNCLTGEKLFSADSIEETVEQVCSKPIPAPSTLLPNLPSDIDAVVMKALARNPKTRYSSAEEMLLALRDASRRLGELATGGEIAQWVRSVADDEFSKRRLAILDASRHPTVPPDAEAQEPLSVAVPLVSTTASEPPDIESNTVAFAVSPRRGRRIALLVAGLLAIVAVVATLMFPRVVASFFRLNTDPVALPEQGQFDIGTFRDSPAPSGSVETSPVPQGSAGARVVPGGSKGKQGL